MMSINLINDAWIPVWTRAGTSGTICPAEAAIPIVLAMPRPDLNGALTEFLIALLTTAAVPSTKRHGVRGGHRRHAQMRSGRVRPIEIHASATWVQCRAYWGPSNRCAGEEAKKKNTDFLSRAGTVAALSPSAAAASVIALQSYATQGGRGYATNPWRWSTLDNGESGSTLWGRLWPNVETREQISEKRGASSYSEAHDAIYPWLSQWRDSTVTPMVRTPSLSTGRCHVAFNSFCHLATARRAASLERKLYGLVRECRVQSGIKYAGWQHPLTPYWRRLTEEWLPARGRVDRIGYRDGRRARAVDQ